MKLRTNTVKFLSELYLSNLFNLVLFTELHGQTGKLIIDKVFLPIKSVDGSFVEGNVGPFTKVFYGDEIFQEITKIRKETGLIMKRTEEIGNVSSSNNREIISETRELSSQVVTNRSVKGVLENKSINF